MIAVMNRQGVTVVLAEHRLAWITDLADKYFFFAAGRLAAQWSAAEFAALPADTLAGYGLRARTLDDAAPESAQSRVPDAPVRRCSRWRASRWAATKSTRCAPARYELCRR